MPTPADTFCVGYLMDEQCNIKSLSDLLPTGGTITVPVQTQVTTAINNFIQRIKSLAPSQQWIWILVVGGAIGVYVYGRRRKRK